MSEGIGIIPLTPVPSPLPGARGAIAFKGQISGWKARATGRGLQAIVQASRARHCPGVRHGCRRMSTALTPADTRPRLASLATYCDSLRGFAASREANSLKSAPHSSAAKLPGSGREGQNSGWKARATENANRPATSHFSGLGVFCLLSCFGCGCGVSLRGVSLRGRSCTHGRIQGLQLTRIVRYRCCRIVLRHPAHQQLQVSF